MNNPLLIVDLDDTLIDTADLKVNLFKNLSQKSLIPEPDIIDIYQSLKINNILSENWPDLLAGLLSFQSKLTRQEVIKIIFTLPRKIKVNYTVLNYVKKFSGFKILLTSGSKMFQNAKIKHLQLSGYFDRLIVIPGNKKIYIESLLSKNYLALNSRTFHPVIIIDDQADYLTPLVKPWLTVIHPGDLAI